MEKSYVSLEQKVCPVCACKHTHDCGILLDRRLASSMEHYTTTGLGVINFVDGEVVNKLKSMMPKEEAI